MPKKTTEGAEEVAGDTSASTGFYFYWLKVPCYKSGITDEKGKTIEPYEMLQDGLFQFSEPVPRLDLLATRYGTEYVEAFVGSIPAVPLQSIAKRYGFSILRDDGQTYIPDAELLAKILESFTV